MSFSAFELHHDLLKAVKEKGFDQPTPIQRLAIPPLLQGRDILARAVPRSGKTAAFLLPLLQQLMDQPRGKTRVLVLAPTRELAVQINEHWAEFARYTGLEAAAVYGGVSPAPQAKAFRDRVAAIMASVREPGNLRFDFLQDPEDPTRFMFYEAYRSDHDAVLHKQTIHYATWRDAVAEMMAEPRRGEQMVGLLPKA